MFDLQTAVAESFGYRVEWRPQAPARVPAGADAPLLLGRQAVTQLNQILMLNIEPRVRLAGRADAPDQRALPRTGAGMLEVASDDLYEREPHAILGPFVYQRTPGIKGCRRARCALAQRREVMDAKFRRDPANRRPVPPDPAGARGQTHALRLMNQTSVLGATCGC